MKTFLSIFSRLVAISFSLWLVSCTPPPTLFTKYSKVDLAANTPAEQVQSKITIKLQPVNDKEYEKTWYTQSIDIPFTDVTTNKPMVAPQNILIQLYNQLTVFEVTVVNNTDHILRMKDSRVIYIDPDKDDPIIAFDKSSMIEDARALPCFNITTETLSKTYPISNYDILSQSITRGIKNILDHVPFVNGFNKEIMPGMKTSGYIVFPLNPEKASEGKVSFIDMVSETDQAGNPIKKVRFDYKVTPVVKYFKMVYDKNAGKYSSWAETDEKDYNIGSKK